MHLSSQHIRALAPLLILEILLVGVCLVGDQLLTDLEDGLLKALSDNITHILIGVLSWFIIIYNVKTVLSENLQTSLAQCVAAAAISSLIDIDHFIMAKSIHLEVDKPNFDYCTNYILDI